MILQIFILSLTISSHSQVNLRDGGLEIERKVLPIRTFYQSRSLYRGELGLGWWLDYETHLEFLPNQKVLWHHGPQQRLFANSQTSSYGSWRLRCTDKYCEVTNEQGGFYAFSTTGRLLSWKDPQDNSFSIVKMTSQRLPHLIRDVKKTQNYVTVRDRESGQLVRLGPWRFIYGSGSQDELLTAISATRKLESYAYSPLANLTQIQGVEPMSIKYNEYRDQVIEMTTSDRCRITLNYESKQKDRSLRLQTLRKRWCAFNPPMISTHTYDLILTGEEWGLLRTRVQWQDKIWEAIHDPETQQIQIHTSSRPRGNH